MWQEVAAAVAAALLGTAAFWNGFVTAGAVYLLNAVLAIHILYLTLTAHAISRFDRRTGREHAQRKWLLWLASLAAAVAVVMPVVLKQASSVPASRDNLIFGGLAFFFSAWAALVPAPEEDGEDGSADTAEPEPAP